MEVQAASGCALEGCAYCLGNTLAGEIACKRNDFKPCKTKLAEAKKCCLRCCKFGDSSARVRCAYPVADVADVMSLVDLIDASAADYGARFGFDDAKGEFGTIGPGGLCKADPGGGVFMSVVRFAPWHPVREVREGGAYCRKEGRGVLGLEATSEVFNCCWHSDNACSVMPNV